MKKILLVRNDKIGDFMLAWPSFALLKASVPDACLVALVPAYTAELAKACPYLDEVIIDAGKKAGKPQKRETLQRVKEAKPDASICLFSDSYNAGLMWRAGIKERWAPATKLAQLLYTDRVKQRRSQSAKPEFEYNLDVVRAYLKKHEVVAVQPKPPFWSFDASELKNQKHKLAQALNICYQKPWLMIHAGTGGSANNLTTGQYSQVTKGLCDGFEVIITAGPGESVQAHNLADTLANVNVAAVVYDKNEGLVDFSKSIACASVFMAGSTGPLHIAATLDVPTIGFFPAKRSSTPLRWRPLNSEGRHLAFSPPQTGSTEDQADMTRINSSEVVSAARPWVEQFLF